MFPKLRLNNNILTVIYKLLNDVLFIVLVFFLLALIAEGFLPDVISSHISFTKTIIFIALIMAAISISADLIGVNIQNGKINKKIAFFWLFISAALIFGSLWKLNISLNLFILTLALITGYYIFRVTLRE